MVMTFSTIPSLRVVLFVSTRVKVTKMTGRIVDGKLHVAGYVYYKSKTRGGRTYWECRLVKQKQCTARAISTDVDSPGELVIFKGPAESAHSHPPNIDESAAEQFTSRVKRLASEHPQLPPSQILRTEMPTVSEGVLSQLPEQEALSKSMRRARRKNLPPNPRRLTDFVSLPRRYRETLLGETFLLHDSGPPEADSEVESGDEDEDVARVLVFATRRNIELLCDSTIWFLDGTFKTSPAIFCQIFTILGLRKRNVEEGEGVPLPYVYALLTHKTQAQYRVVLETVKTAVENYRVQQCVPTKIMCDFELAILNACAEVYPNVPTSGCFFHLGQSAYRRIQTEGLQRAYTDENDRSLKTFLHTVLALAFVPVADVPAAFQLLRNRCPPCAVGFMDYFDSTYVRGRPRRGRRRAVAPRYEIRLWNQYQAALDQSHRTNNASEGWHNRFRIVIGKHHPDLYAALTEFQKEQAYTEVCIAELSLGKRVKTAPKQKWVELHTRIQAIVRKYEEYKARGDLEDYLRTIGHNIVLT